jgi:hypothetical protein
LKREKGSYDSYRPTGSTPQRESNNERQSRKRNTNLGDYEQTLNEMRQIMKY